ncbi:alpha/beta hydrolase family esterase [Amycolatopsis lurida]
MLRRPRSARLLLAAAAVLPALLAAAPATASPGPADRPVPTTGCGLTPPVAPGTTGAQTLVSGGLTREYTVHLPANYQPHRPTSLVLSFHGHKRTSQWQEELSEFSGVNTIAVYPQGLIGTDGGTAWTGAPYSADADDVLFTSDLLTKLQSQLCVDPRRIYATGKSNGGGFVGVLACHLPGRIAAFAPVAGAYYPQGGECSPSRPAPILAFHGTADATIPYDGNPAKGLPAIPDWLEKWAERDGCFTHPVTYSPQEKVTVQKWLGCDKRSSLEHYRIDGAGHVWPSTKPNNDSATPTVLDATPVIWRFFQGQRLR